MAVPQKFKALRFMFAMVLGQIVTAVQPLLAGRILKQGTSIFPLMTYRYMIGALSLTFAALVLEREMIKGINWSRLRWLIFSSFLGISFSSTLYYLGLRDTSPTYATVCLNFNPIVTFLLCIGIRSEQLNLWCKSGLLKVGGSISFGAGALIYVLYRGTIFSVQQIKNVPTYYLHNELYYWVRGSLFLLASCLGAAGNSLVMGALISGSYKLVNFWVIKNKGPVYPTLFSSLSLVLVAISDVLISGESISTGNIIGLSIIVLGSSLFMWGKVIETPGISATKEDHDSSADLLDGWWTIFDTAPDDAC